MILKSWKNHLKVFSRVAFVVCVTCSIFISLCLTGFCLPWKISLFNTAIRASPANVVIHIEHDTSSWRLSSKVLITMTEFNKLIKRFWVQIRLKQNVLFSLYLSEWWYRPTTEGHAWMPEFWEMFSDVKGATVLRKIWPLSTANLMTAKLRNARYFPWRISIFNRDLWFHFPLRKESKLNRAHIFYLTCCKTL